MYVTARLFIDVICINDFSCASMTLITIIIIIENSILPLLPKQPTHSTYYTGSYNTCIATCIRFNKGKWYMYIIYIILYYTSAMRICSSL